MQKIFEDKFGNVYLAFGIYRLDTNFINSNIHKKPPLLCQFVQIYFVRIICMKNFKLQKILFRLLLSAILMSVAACNTTKYVPEGEFLLDKVKINTENKLIPKEEIYTYIRQLPNAEVLGLFKMQLGIYNLSGNDTTKWTTKWLKKIGDEPVIFNQQLNALTEKQIDKLFFNRGYLNAAVSSDIQYPKAKTAQVTYNIKANAPYKIRNYTANINQAELQAIAADSVQSLIKRGGLFNSDLMDEERNRVASRFRNAGYFNFAKDYLRYNADSALRSNEVDIKLELRNDLNNLDSANTEKLFRKYKIGKVIFHCLADNTLENLATRQEADSFAIGKYHFIYEKDRNIRPSVLSYSAHLIPGMMFSDRAVERSHSTINSLSAVKYTDISFKEAAGDELDAYITITPNKLQTISTDVESTYSDGFYGLGGNINYGHRNIFRGSEMLTLRGRASYEYQGKSQHAFELGGDIGLKFPTFLLPLITRETKRNIRATTEFNTSFSYRKRPGEYTGIVTGVGYKYSWSERARIKHNLDVLNISYVYYPFISDSYREYLSTSPYFVYNFQNHLIMSSSYKGSYSNFNTYQPLRNFITMNYGVEIAGNTLNALNHIFKSSRDSVGAYKIFGIRYAQYAKADFNLSHNQIFDSNNRIVYHLGFGLTVPYGNSTLVPFEKRYFSGGANSVRGWTAYQLGPGTYKSRSGVIDYNTQMGDIKIDLNMEYRTKLFWKLEGALFIDAGNVWTIRDYDTQSGGVFRFKDFVGQMGVAYGGGIRADFSFVILRLDMGLKLYDPSRSRTESWRTKITKDDYAFNLAIGYPF